VSLRIAHDCHTLLHTQQNSTYPDAGYPGGFGPSGKFVENSPKLFRFDIGVYWIKCSTVSWLLDLQIRCGREVQTQVKGKGKDKAIPLEARSGP
jgi:hypothetical protein